MVGIKGAPNEISAKIPAFRKESEERTDLHVMHYRTIDELREQTTDACNEWRVR